jgi:ubiquinone/menaquinone biosynthesis C-methylase UbiE
MDESWRYLNDLSWDYRAARTLHAAVRIGLFTQAARQPQTVGELAAACRAREDLLEKVLIACCAMGLLKKEGEKYANTDLSQTYLVEGRPLYQGDMIRHAARVWDFWTTLPEELEQTPRPPTEAEMHRSFILAMHNITMGGRGPLFLDVADLSGRKRLLDVGGGPGTYSVLACRKYPQLQAVVFDLPQTVAVARRRIREEGLEDRIAFVEGDWDTDELPTGFDAALLSNVLHGRGSNAKSRLQKVHRSLEPGGEVFVQEFVLRDDKTGPLIPALFNIMVGAYSRRELFEVLEQAGFEAPRQIAQSDTLGATWIAASKQGLPA